jgi:hypothetical protein
MVSKKKLRVNWLQIIAWIIGFSALAVISYGIIISLNG